MAALFALDLDLAQVFQHKSVKSHGTEHLTAQDTRVGLFATEPCLDAVFAEKLVTRSTLLGVLHDTLANTADEVVVYWLANTKIGLDVVLCS